MSDDEKQPTNETPLQTSNEKSASFDRLAADIGKRIADARTGLGWSQTALHTRTKLADPEGVGISRAVLSLYETGKNKPGAREIRILCDTLKVSPNWLLYGSESPARAIQASVDFLQGSDIDVSARLAFALLALDPTERDSLAQLVLSILTKKLGDVRLSSLMMTANLLSAGLMREIVDFVGDDAKKLPLPEIIDRCLQQMADGFYTNYGNLRPVVEDEDFDPSVDTPPPPRKLK